MSENQAPGQAAPGLRIVAGRPTAAEAAAVTVVLAAALTARAAMPRPLAASRPSLWTARALRPPVVPGPGAWRASGLPR